MSFFKKLGETMKDTASTIGAKSMDMVETGKLKIQKGQLEGNIEQKKTELGHLIYLAHKQDTEPDSDGIKKIFADMKELENQIAEIEEKLHKEAVQAAPQPAAENAQVVYCSKCGEKIPAGVKFCSNCGQPQ